jgi:hypothetical protein
MTWDEVVEIGLLLPGVELGTAYGTGGRRVKAKSPWRERANPGRVRELVGDAWAERAPTRLVEQRLQRDR